MIWGRWLVQDRPLKGLPGLWSVGIRNRPHALVLVHREDADDVRLDVLPSSEAALARGWPKLLLPDPKLFVAEPEQVVEPEPEPTSPGWDDVSSSLPPLRVIDDDRGAEAVELVRRVGHASVSMLQRELVIGHPKELPGSST